MIKRTASSLLASLLLSFLLYIYLPSELISILVIGVVLFVMFSYHTKKGGLSGLYFSAATGLSIFVTIETINPSKSLSLLSLSGAIFISFLLTYYRNRTDHSSRSKYSRRTLGILFMLLWLVLAFGVSDRQDWIIENIVMLVFTLIIFVIDKKNNKCLTEVSIISIFIFSFLHSVGAHYTYMSVPFGYLFTDFFLLSRNYYDTFVHFAFGLMLSGAFRDMYLSKIKDSGIISYIFPVLVVCTFALTYEVIEWLITFVLDQNTIPMFLASQGDNFDTQKDMAVALVGVCLYIVSSKLFKYSRQGN